jgi:hypothetical protein
VLKLDLLNQELALLANFSPEQVGRGWRTWVGTGWEAGNVKCGDWQGIHHMALQPQVSLQR